MYDDGDVTIYVDGEAPSQTQNPLGTVETDDTAAALTIGNASKAYDGYMYDARFYNTTLSAEDMLALHNSYGEQSLSRLGSIRDIFSPDVSRSSFLRI